MVRLPSAYTPPRTPVVVNTLQRAAQADATIVPWYDLISVLLNSLAMMRERKVPLLSACHVGPEAETGLRPWAYGDCRCLTRHLDANLE